MTKEVAEDKLYPVRSLHDFMYELNREWSKFRNGTLIGLASSGVLFIVVVSLIFRVRRLELGVIEFSILVLVGVLLGYSIYAMYSQYRFFNRWERRIGLLLHLEQQILNEESSEKKLNPL